MTFIKKILLTTILILLIHSSELKAQLNISDTLIFESKKKNSQTFIEIYPDSTYFYFTKTFPKYHSRGNLIFSSDTLKLSSLTIEKNIEDSTQTPMYVWLNLDQEEFLIEKDYLIKLSDKKEKFKKIKKE